MRASWRSFLTVATPLMRTGSFLQNVIGGVNGEDPMEPRYREGRSHSAESHNSTSGVSSSSGEFQKAPNAEEKLREEEVESSFDEPDSCPQNQNTDDELENRLQELHVKYVRKVSKL